MKRVILLNILTVSLLLSSCKTLGTIGLKPSHLETVTALQKILDSSTFQALNLIRKGSVGIEGLLPKELGQVLGTLKTLGYDEEIRQVNMMIKKASTVALEESKGILGDAIKNINFGDAVAVVLGGEDAATSVLKKSMYKTVKQRYSQRLAKELSKTDVSKYWPLAVQGYNLFASEKIEDSLPDFLAERAVDGLFLAIGKQEAKARVDYTKIGSDVVTKVFDYYIKNKK